MLDIGFDVADAAILGILRVGGYLYALLGEVSREESEKLRKAREEAEKEKA